ncbi:MAG: sigma 54-interacting transcriptional regulator [Ignavibacteriae bacterium]|nr:sigma 54-interacting transcriptional regulator [Ignavibacteriota bacterium]
MSKNILNIDFTKIAELSKNYPSFKQALNVARFQRLSVLLTSKSGFGKESHTHCIHQNSPKVKKPFKTINASALPEHFLKSELFGHINCAYTGAFKKHGGLFKEAK